MLISWGLVELEEDDDVRRDNGDEGENGSFLHEVKATRVEGQLSATFQFVHVELVRVLSSRNVSKACGES